MKIEFVQQIIFWITSIFQQLRGDLEEKNREIEDLKDEKIRIQSNSDKLDHSLTEQRSINDSLSKQLGKNDKSIIQLRPFVYVCLLNR